MPARQTIRFNATRALLTFPAAYDRNRRDAIADLESADAAADFDDFAGRIDAEDMGHLDGHRIITGAHYAIKGAIDRHRMNFDDDLAGCRFWFGDIFEMHDLGCAELSDDDGFHSDVQLVG